ncbi:MAG: chromosome condensation protein CrcB [Candidatus Cloacimonetes bacterium 4572_55]|nr:MAG: chromosome condensation protein CrcB [Candidatus Cloacimonetes bacterium 4572_55]
MQKILLVGMGGFFGAIMRYVVSDWIYQILRRPRFPYSTLGVNLIGCLLIGLLSGLAEERQIFSPEIRLLVFIGFLGSFTTFSTFGYEIFKFARDGQMLSSLANLTLHIVLGLLAVWLGFTASRIF